MREATRSDLPVGNKEAQCPICWRMFSTDRNCERHKPYSKRNGTQPGEYCKNPEDVGLVQEERRGFAVWKEPGKENLLQRLRPDDFK